MRLFFPLLPRPRRVPHHGFCFSAPTTVFVLLSSFLPSLLSPSRHRPHVTSPHLQCRSYARVCKYSQPSALCIIKFEKRERAGRDDARRALWAAGRVRARVYIYIHIYTHTYIYTCIRAARPGRGCKKKK